MAQVSAQRAFSAAQFLCSYQQRTEVHSALQALRRMMDLSVCAFILSKGVGGGHRGLVLRNIILHLIFRSG
jgi:hypothetical protein